MKKSKLLVLSIVALMTACNKPAPAPVADLPAGGEEVVYKKDDKEAEKVYSDSLAEVARGALNSVNQDKIQFDINAKGNVKGIERGESVKSDADVQADVSVYLAIPASATSESAYIKIDVKNITATITNALPGEKEGEYKNLVLEGLKLSIDIEDRADTLTYAYIDLSDKSIENALTPLMGEGTSLMLNALLGPNRKIYANLSQLMAENPITLPIPMLNTDGEGEGSETEPEVEPIPMILTTFAMLGRMLVSGVMSQITTIDLSTVDAKFLPTIKTYKDEAGAINRIGVQGTYDLIELIDEFAPKDQPVALAAEEPTLPDVNVPEIKSGRISAAGIVGKTKGSSTFALEEVKAYADVETVDGISSSAELSVNAKYNSQVNLVRLTNEQKALYNKDIGELISSILGLIGTMGGGILG